MHELYCVISGKVQGVAYRTFVQDAAGKLSLAGYARNLPDGTVEIVAQSDPDSLKALVEYLHEGSLLSTVEAVAVDWRTARQHFDDFSILHD